MISSLVATGPDEDTNYTDYVYPNRIAIVVGSEAHGLERPMVSNCARCSDDTTTRSSRLIECCDVRHNCHV